MSTSTHPARRLAAALEPVAGQVYFGAECHAEYVALGFGGSPGEFNGVAGPDVAAYFTSRGSVMGQVAPDVVAAAFGVFDPAAVLPAVAHGWSITDAATICAARDRGAIAHLTRVLGDDPPGLERATALLERAVAPLRREGRALFSGLSSLGVPTEPIGQMWRRADQLREYRGDSHLAAWVAAGLDAVEICVLSDPFYGLPMRSYSRSRGWSKQALLDATDRLARRGFVADDQLTEAGRELRESIERATDAQMAPAIAALGDDLDELVAILRPWGADIRAAKGYPPSGPHDLAGTDH